MGILNWLSGKKQRVPLTEAEFAVVDVETTGLFPQRHDRVIEIAAIRVNAEGVHIRSFTTLLNPCRDVGPTHIHRITAGDLLHAPPFEEIAGDVISVLAGAIFVAHNVQFDYGFVSAEVMRLGHELPETPALCTMTMAQTVADDLPGRKLEVCCKHFGVNLEDAHSAYADACATAKLMAACFAEMRQMGVQFLDELGIPEPPPEPGLWPQLLGSGRTHTRRSAAERREATESFIAKVISRLPASKFPSPRENEYFALLDRVLEDRRITPEEADKLFELAADYGIGRDQAIDLHKRYLTDLVRTALADGVITESEERDIDEVRKALSLSRDDYETCVMQKAEVTRQAVASADTLEGRTVCFTGELSACYQGEPITRAMAERLASEKGMIVRKSVTKDLDFLVVADPDSMSSKAKKGRAYGVRIIAEAVFWRMIGVHTD